MPRSLGLGPVDALDREDPSPPGSRTHLPEEPVGSSEVFAELLLGKSIAK